MHGTMNIKKSYTSFVTNRYAAVYRVCS